MVMKISLWLLQIESYKVSKTKKWDFVLRKGFCDKLRALFIFEDSFEREHSHKYNVIKNFA